MSKQDLLEEKERLPDFERYCNEIIDFIEDENQELDLSSDMTIIGATVLRVIADSINRRHENVVDLIDFAYTKGIDRIRKHL